MDMYYVMDGSREDSQFIYGGRETVMKWNLSSDFPKAYSIYLGKLPGEVLSCNPREKYTD